VLNRLVSGLRYVFSYNNASTLASDLYSDSARLNDCANIVLGNITAN